MKPGQNHRNASMTWQKYYLVVMLIEITGVEELVEKLKKGKFVSKQDILMKSELSSVLLCSTDDLVIFSETSNVRR